VIFSLDSNVVIELVRSRRSPVREHFFNALQERHQLMASLIVLHELRFGCERSQDLQKELANVQTVLFWTQIEALDETDVVMAAKLRADLQRQGRPIGPYDLLIAG
jgi:tRNA(fMet)-specific endonuclease VapC